MKRIDILKQLYRHPLFFLLLFAAVSMSATIALFTYGLYRAVRGWIGA